MLNTALDYGITEKDFWEMTIAEVKRATESIARVRKIEAQEKASYYYTLAGLISKGVAKVLGDKSDYPTIEEVFPSLFADMTAEREAASEEQRMNLSALRFKQFAQTYNKKLKNKEVQNKE